MTPRKWTEYLETFSRRLDGALGQLPERWRKPLYFGTWGAIGCFLGALLFGELALALLMPGPPKKPEVDVVFVLDVTSSMQPSIDGVAQGVRDFAKALGGKNELDSRIGLVAFRDRVVGEEARVLDFSGSPLTSDVERFRGEVAKLRAQGGDDFPETSLDGIDKACSLPFRPAATKALVLITDAPPKLPDGLFHKVADIQPVIAKAGVKQVHLVVRENQRAIYAPVQEGVVGQFFALERAARPGGFDDILPDLGREIAEEAIRGLQSGRQVGRSSFWPLLFAIGVWTSTLALGLAWALIVAQNVYLKRGPLSVDDGLKGGLSGLAAGFVAGGAGQFLYQVVPYRPFQLAGWALLGCLVGTGMAFFVPNLDRKKALQAGAIGGAVGCLGFLLAAFVLGDFAGRVVGAAVLGLAIGLMVGLVETAFREAWLEVAYGPDGKEKRAVSLGPVPVTVGSARDCKVWARDAEPVAFRYKYEAGKVTCEDVAAKKADLMGEGDQRSAGLVKLTVHLTKKPGGAGAAPATGSEAKPKPAPAPPASTPSTTRAAGPPGPIKTAPPAKAPVVPGSIVQATRSEPTPAREPLVPMPPKPPVTRPVAPPPPKSPGPPGAKR